MSRSLPTPVDVIVIGGGPSGAAAGRMLARLGREVLLIPGRPDRRTPLGESLPPSTRKPLEALGLLEAMEAEGFVENRGNLSSWGEDGLRRTDFQGPPGFQVERTRLDRVLLAATREAGVRVVDEASVTRVELDRDRPLVAWTADGREGKVQARWVLDASGRAGVLARATGARTAAGDPPTIALLGIWRLPVSAASSDAYHTFVEAYEDGWAWAVPIEPGLRFVATMVDPRETRLTRENGVRGMYRAELAKTRHLRGRLGSASLVAGPWACAATPYAARRYTGQRHLLVGDAGSFLDPLSSFGVKKALASGWLAAIAVNTALADAELAGSARDLFEERERAAEGRYSADARRHYRIGWNRHGTSFWRCRSEAPSALEGVPAGAPPTADTPGPDTGSDPESLADDPIVRDIGFPRTDPRLREAFLQVRDADPLRITRGPAVHIVRAPTVQGSRIVLEERLRTPETPEGGIRHHRGVDLPALAALAPQASRVPDLYESYTRDHPPPVPLPDFLEALSALVVLDVLRLE